MSNYDYLFEDSGTVVVDEEWLATVRSMRVAPEDPDLRPYYVEDDDE